MMDHARRPDLADWQRPANLPWDRYKLLLEEDCWRECRDRTRRHRLSEHVRWHSFQQARVLPAADKLSTSRFHFESRIHQQGRGHSSAPRVPELWTHRSIER